MPRRWSRALAAAFFGFAALAVASCGSRTGLFGSNGAGAGAGAGADASRDAAEEPVGCRPGSFRFELATAQLMFVLDRSGSMAFSLSGQDPVPEGQPSRWEALRDALSATIVPLQYQIAMGAKFFPEVVPDDSLGEAADACRVDTGVAIPPATGSASAILDVFARTEPRGGTPTSDAVRLAAAYMAGRRSVVRTIILATDGAPNCNGDLDPRSCTCTTPGLDCSRVPERGRFACLDGTRTVSVVADVFQSQRIPVYVIGIGSAVRPELLDVLDDMAVAGGRPRAGTPRHYDVQSALELREALSAIQSEVARCTYLTPSAPTDPDAITVEVGGRRVPRDPSRQSGWEWVDQAYGTLALFGAACEEAGKAGAGVTGTVTCDD